MKLERYRSTMTKDVLHSWAADAQAEIDRLRAWQESLLKVAQMVVRSDKADTWGDACRPIVVAAQAAIDQTQPLKKHECDTCGDSGDVHRADGEWLGECPHCKPAPLPDSHQENSNG